MKQLEGRVAVVTGAASGIGRALAERFAAEHMRVVLADVEPAPLEEVTAGLVDAGAVAIAVPTDVSKADQVDALRDAALDAFGAVHVVCNNAGVGGGGPIAELETVDWEWVIGVNLWGVIHGLRAFLPTLVAQDEAHVVNTASMAGLVTAPFMGPYNATKFAVVAVSETLHKEMQIASPHVGVSVLCPGWVNTAIADSERNRPAELQRAVERPDTSDGAIREMVRGLLATGMPPAEVASLVVDAMRERRLYVITHPDMKPSVEQRMQDILGERNPQVVPPIA